MCEGKVVTCSTTRVFFWYSNFLPHKWCHCVVIQVRVAVN